MRKSDKQLGTPWLAQTNVGVGQDLPLAAAANQPDAVERGPRLKIDTALGPAHCQGDGIQVQFTTWALMRSVGAV